MTEPLPDLTIRAIEPEDAPALTALHALPGFRHGTLRLPYPRIEAARARIAALPPGDHMLAGLIGGVLVGAGGLRRLGGRQSHVGEIGLGVHDAWTGQRVGTRLMAALIDIADNWIGLRRLQLTVNTDNHAAIALYQRAGFRQEGRLRQDVLRAGLYVDSLVMGRVVEIPSEPNYHDS
jgi:putative acetyltransferase